MSHNRPKSVLRNLDEMVEWENDKKLFWRVMSLSCTPSKLNTVILVMVIARNLLRKLAVLPCAAGLHACIPVACRYVLQVRRLNWRADKHFGMGEILMEQDRWLCVCLLRSSLLRQICLEERHFEVTKSRLHWKRQKSQSDRRYRFTRYHFLQASCSRDPTSHGRARQRIVCVRIASSLLMARLNALFDQSQTFAFGADSDQ